MKAQVTIIEVVLTLIALFIAYTILFPKYTYRSNWDDSLSLMKGRDILISLDRIGRLYDISFNPSEIQNIKYKILYGSGMTIWPTTEGVIKNNIYVACNCSNNQINYLNEITENFKLNDRNIDFVFCPTNLEVINPCPGNKLLYPDTLIIWGYSNMSSGYLYKLQSFINKDSGILEIVDLGSTQIDEVQQKIFGLKFFNDNYNSINVDSITKPEDVSKSIYQLYKYFYHIPLPLKSTITSNIPVEGIPSPLCSQNSTGIFRFNSTSYSFWSCDSTSVYWDTNNNNIADYSVNVEDNFILSGYNFYLNYINSNVVGISFKQNYTFNDFLKNGNSKVYPIDDNTEKIFLYNGNWTNQNQLRVPVVIVNGTNYGKTVWVGDFSRNGLNQIEDDHKNLLLSMILYISNKETQKPINIKKGFLNSFINVNKEDMFEVYKLNLILGLPF